MRKVILASASPRRKALLEQAGITFEVVPARTEEKTAETAPDRVVMALASMKAQEVFDKISEHDDMTQCVVLGADTVVSCGGSILGNPRMRQMQNVRLRCFRESSMKFIPVYV